MENDPRWKVRDEGRNKGALYSFCVYVCMCVYLHLSLATPKANWLKENHRTGLKYK